MERLRSRRALIPLGRVHGFHWRKVGRDGDCFYASVVSACGLGGDVTGRIIALRAEVAREFGAEQLEMYRILATLGTAEYEWAEALRADGALDSLEAARLRIRRPATRDVSGLWADAFAIGVVARRLCATILFVDMDRAREQSPYRVLARGGAAGSPPRAYIVLKLQRGHFEPLVHTDAESGREITRWARFGDLPPVVRALWPEE